jgi:hypothetical protein
MLIAGCVAVQAGTKPTGKTYDFASYSIDVPVGGDWGVEEANQATEAVAFRRANYAIMAETVTSSTQLSVQRLPVRQQDWASSEEELANRFWQRTEQALAKEGGQEGFALTNIHKGAESITPDQRMYFMSCDGGVGNWFVGGKGFQSLFYLYFPPDYAQRRAAYLFTMTTWSVKGSIYSESASKKVILQFIGGFRLKPLPSSPDAPPPGT